MASLQPPPTLKPVSHYLKVAVEHETRDPVIAYWARFATVQKALTIDKSSPEAKVFVISLLEWLENKKKALASNEAVTIEAAGEAHIENYALKLFNWADQSDRGAVFNKNVVKAFYTTGVLFDILESLRPPLSDEFLKARKYAKWKAAYIHNCLKNGETPVPGEGLAGGSDEEEGDQDEPHSSTNNPGGSYSFGFVDPNKGTGGGGGTSSAWGGAAAGGTSSDNNFYGLPTGRNEISPGPPPAAAPYQPPVPPQHDYGGGAQYGDSGGAAAAACSVPASSLSIEQIAKAQKYCKFAGSALNFDDVNSAIDNLEKALHLLKTGQDTG